jgi:hypothetical protein
MRPEKIETAPAASRSATQIFPITTVNEESQRILLTPEPGRRIEFPDPLKSITSPRPERRLPGDTTPPSAPIEQGLTPAQSESVLLPSAPEPVRLQSTPEQPAPDRVGKIALQINTVPIHCQVIVDDKVMGQSPLTVYVDRYSSHVVQIFRDGYEEKTKVLDRQFFGTDATYLLIEKLELKK